MASQANMGPANKLVGKLREDISRHPSPQPSHISFPHPIRSNANGHRVLRSATVGYVAPEFKGKAQQMKEGAWRSTGRGRFAQAARN